MDWDKLSKILRIQNWLILFILASASFFLMSSSFTLGIILGGLIIIVNFNVLQHTIRCAFSSEGFIGRKKRSVIMKYYLRLAAIGVLIYFLITQGWVHPVGLTIGLSTVVISIFSLGVHMIWKTSSGKAV